MSRTLPTEESLGLSPTEDELNTTVTVEDDDIPINDDAEPALAPAKPGAEQKTQKADEPAGDDKDKPAEGEQQKAEEPKLVDVRAVQEARAEAREAKRLASVMEQRLNDILAARQLPPQQAEPEKPAVPGPDDPMGRLNWTTEQIVAFNERQAKEAAERQQQTQQEQAYQQAFAQVDAQYTAALATDPTLGDAYNALRESQGKELLALGYSVPEAKAELDRIERQHVMYVAQRGISIADHIKNLAQVRGWQAKAPEQAQQQKTDIAAVAAAQQRHQSLSDAPGGETIPVMDAKQLAKMTDKQFKDWMSKKGNEAKFDQIMGA